jgi:DNA-binding SARP family transcriptional activator
VELHLAGAFRVVRDSIELTDGQVGSRKSRTLLKLLAVERPGLVPVDRIVAILWPDGQPAAPERNVAILVSRLRAALGPDLIQGGRAGYRLAAPDVVVDLDEAARFCAQAEGKLEHAAAVALAAAERALMLLSAGTALGEEPYAEWADPAREQVRGLLRRARLAAAEAALATGEPRRAAGYAEAAVAADPLDETAHRWCMSAAAASGEPARALAVYEALRQRLGAELGAEPAPPTRELHVAILRERGGSTGPAAARTARDRPGSPPKPGSPTSLAGRDQEIGELREAWHQAAGGQPALVMITGEAGIGKTALAEALAAEASHDGGTVLRTRCYETERSLFLQPAVEAIAPVAARTSAGPLRQMLGEHAAAAAGLLPEVAAILGPPPPGQGSVEMERRRAFEAVRAFLRGLAERSPVLFLVDDLQYAGQSTVELMHFLGRERPGTRMLLVTAVRAENDAQAGAALAPVARRVELGPLGPEAVAVLARAAGQGGLAGQILEQTRGHPLFVVEVLRALASGQAGLPESLRTAVQARVRRAGLPVENLLRAASVLGSAVDPLTLGALLDLVPASALELCEAALEARLLVVAGRDYEFANDLIREVLYASTPEPTRLADLTLGAEQARAAGDRRLEMLALYELGSDIPVQRGLPMSDHTTSLENGLRIAESLGDRASEAHLLSHLAIIGANRLRLDTAADLGLRGVAAGRAAGDDHALAAGLDGLKSACLCLGDLAALTGVLAELIPLLRRLGDPFLLQWAEFENAFPAIAAADWGAAMAAMESAVEINDRAGYPHCAVWYVAHQGWLARLRGRTDDAIRLGHQALERTERHEVAWWRATASAILGGTVLLAGDRAQAISLFEQGLDVARQAGMEAYMLRCAAPLAAVTGSRAMLGEAAGLLDQASFPAGGAWMPGYEAYLSLAEAWLAHGDPEQARTVLAPMLAVADREPWLPALAAALVTDGRALIRLGQPGQARPVLDRAVRLAGDHGLPHVLRDAREARGQAG